MGFPPQMPIGRNLFPANPFLPTSLNAVQKTKASNASEKIDKDKTETTGSGKELEQTTQQSIKKPEKKDKLK